MSGKNNGSNKNNEDEEFAQHFTSHGLLTLKLPWQLF